MHSDDVRDALVAMIRGEFLDHCRAMNYDPRHYWDYLRETEEKVLAAVYKNVSIGAQFTDFQAVLAVKVKAVFRHMSPQ